MQSAGERDGDASAQATGIQPKSLAITYQPATLTLIYSDDQGKLRKRTMPVRGLRADSNPAVLSRDIIRAHPQLLAPHLVSNTQVERLMKRLVEHKQQQQQQHGSGLITSKSDAAGQPSQSSGSGGGGGALSSSSSIAANASAGAKSMIPGTASSSALAPAAAASKATEPSAPLPDLSDDGDLNAVSEEQLKAAKAEMDVLFQKKVLRPGDPGYVHDKRVEVPAELEDNEWDDDLDDFETDDEDDKLMDLLKGA